MFYTYRQNNTGGTFRFDEASGIGLFVIVEANSPIEADERAEEIGLYFGGRDDCACCGDRWTGAFDGNPTPTVYGDDAFGYRDPFITERIARDGATVHGFVHYANGDVRAMRPLLLV